MKIEALFDSLGKLIKNLSLQLPQIEHLHSFAAITSLLDQFERNLTEKGLWDNKTCEQVKEIVNSSRAIATREVIESNEISDQLMFAKCALKFLKEKYPA